MTKILIVDDNPEMRDMLEWVLTDAGYSLVHATSGRAAFDLLLVEKVDLVITDLEMPDGDGLWLLGRMRSEGFEQKVIVNTGNPLIDGDQIIEAGADGFCRKPYSLPELLSLIQDFKKH